MPATISLYYIYRHSQVHTLIFILVCKSIPINDLATAGLPLTITPFGDQVGEILWMGRSYFITSKFSGYDMSWSLLLTTISRLCTTWSSSRASCAVVISYWLPHFQPPSYSRVASSTICIIL